MWECVNSLVGEFGNPLVGGWGNVGVGVSPRCSPHCVSLSVGLLRGRALFTSFNLSSEVFITLSGVDTLFLFLFILFIV